MGRFSTTTDLVVVAGLPLSRVLATSSSPLEGVSSEQTVLILREELEMEEEGPLQEEVEKFRCKGRLEGER